MKPWRQRRRSGGLALGAALVGLGALVVSLVVLGPYLRVSQPHVPISDGNGDPTGTQERPAPIEDLPFVSILIVGLDEGIRHVDLPPTPETKFADIPLASLRGRADAVMVMGLDRRTGTVRLLHIPRDTIVPMLARGQDKITHFMAYYSFFDLKKEVEEFLGLPIHRYVVVGLDGFASLVDAIGGVTVTLDHDLWEEEGFFLGAGTHRLDGPQALRLVRHRYGEVYGDIARVRLQHDFLVALAKELRQGGFFRALAAYAQTPSLLKTNLSPGETIALFREWKDSDPDVIAHLWVPGHPESHYWRADPVGLRETVEEFWPGDAGWETGFDGRPGEGPGDSGQTAAGRAGPSLAATFLRPMSDFLGLGRQGAWPSVYRPFVRSTPEAPTPAVLIYHTHGTESFLPELIPDAAEREGHDPDREAFSADPALTVVRVGREVAQVLGDLGLTVKHLEAIHDPGGWSGRTGAYARSRATALAALRGLSDPVIVLDIHRDATTYRAPVGDTQAAGILLVVARQNPWWQWNYAFAQNLQDRLEQAAPGLSRGIRILDGRYNQDLSPLALVVEIGGAESTLQECLVAARIFAGALADYVGGP
jgi:stage II sporulation protein P